MIILARELAVTGLRNLAAGRGVLIRASGLGKGKMVAQVTAILLLLLSRPLPSLRIPGLVALVVVVGLTLVSAADYFRRFWKDVVRAPTRTEPGAGNGPK
jgi:CDP-diacylglycerol--glycerol-3-phosphate 3-phosphatidyltransferase